MTFVGAGAAPAQDNVLSLAGTWKFRLDGENVGVEQEWFAQELDDTVKLPGTTDENHKGIKKDEQCIDRLSRVWYWKGPAWYQRRVTIPDAWKGKRITLLFERSKNTRVWVDATYCGGEDTLSAPQLFDVTTAMTPGEHTLTVVVDNAKLPPVGPSHAVDERTQTNWNGMVGKLELRATDPVWLDDVQVYPDVAKKQAVVRAVVGNITGKAASGRITAGCESFQVSRSSTFPSQTIEIHAPERENAVEFIYTLGENVPLWDEFQPAMLRMALDLESTASGEPFRDRRTVDFGMRRFATQRNRLTINGRPVFLRGKLDCCFFPLTGYPPMDKAGWLRVLAIAKSYGINHYRFHSWCPPEAAFEAADQLGMYLQPEVPNKRSAFAAPENLDAAIHNIDRLDVASSSREKSLYEYARREGELIFKAYGNHPSFVMFTLGNELGRTPGMFEMVAHYKQIDPRHLYAQGANNMHWAPSLAAGDDFWITCKTSKTLPVRGAFFQGDYPNPHIEHRSPSTMVDFSEAIAGVPVPVIGHENGSFQVSPDFREIPKYTGVVKARNLEIFRERLHAAGMLDQAHDFVRASGALSVICHREDIETALRTPGFGGFQLLDIQDFPGQGTALVGILNVFMESKGLIEPAAWRQFCCETVPLLRMKKYTWTTDETLIGRVEVAHYGPADLPNARVTWTAKGSDGRAVARGAFGPVSIEQGKVFEVDMFSLPLGDIAAPQKLTITAAVEGTRYRNDYHVWVYPPKVDTSVPPGVLVTDSFTAAATQKHLAAGSKVLLLPKLDRLPDSIKGSFQTDFWCFPMFRRGAERSGIEVAPGTLGILCNPATPALARFPTEFHSNWQWWHLVKNSRPIILDDTPAAYRPTVQVIDNFERNHKLGLIFETKVGQGKLLVCAIDLSGHQDKPEARQMLHSLLQYVASNHFAPKTELDVAVLKRLLASR
ncbi:MAG: beta-galactosidase [Candidatus Nealsonbacteria bacterium]|nr:beta-galactosidase [Candidatus Nealsonbacteria bacterium]